MQFDIEPYLIRSGYAVVGRSERELTAKGQEYLQEATAA